MLTHILVVQVGCNRERHIVCTARQFAHAATGAGSADSKTTAGLTSHLGRLDRPS